jgi:hypothetical protein
LLTVTGGKIGYAAGEYEGLDAPLPAISPSWSPVARFGGYQALPGIQQGQDLTAAAAESAEQLRWRQRRGLSAGAGAGVPDLRRYPADPLLGCF